MANRAEKIRFNACIVVTVGLLLMLGPQFFEAAPAAETVPAKDVVVLKNILIDKHKKEIRIRARLAIKEGILEYLLVSDPGKTYESVFKVEDNVPSELNFALLLIGSNPLGFDRFMELINDSNGLATVLKEYPDSVVELECHQNGSLVGWERLMKNRAGTADALVWVHTGGVLLEGNRYAGDLELSHIGIWPDVSAVINLFSNLGNPYRGGFGLEMNRENMALKVDQDFDIVIKRKKQ